MTGHHDNDDVIKERIKCGNDQLTKEENTANSKKHLNTNKTNMPKTNKQTNKENKKPKVMAGYGNVGPPCP